MRKASPSPDPKDKNKEVLVSIVNDNSLLLTGSTIIYILSLSFMAGMFNVVLN